MTAPDYFNKWTSQLENRLDALDDKLDRLDAHLRDHTIEDRNTTDAIRQELKGIEHNVAGQSGEMKMWRGVVVFCALAILASVVQFCLAQMHIPITKAAPTWLIK